MTAANRLPCGLLTAWFALAVCALPTGAQAQSPDEHARHHPAAAPAPAGGMPAGAPAPAGGMGAGGMPAGGGMMEQMGEMMKGMGKPPPKEIYPSLMALPELTPEKRAEVEQQSSLRMQAGASLLEQALVTLDAGAQSGDYASMHEATTRLREGIAQLESGIAARRALAEGRAPREVALAWFKREMSLVSPLLAEDQNSDRGVSFLHLFTMALLVAFAFAMLALYFFKMRRAAALFGRIEPDKKSPPPGSSPPLDGGGGSPGGKSAPDGKTPPTAKPGADKAAPPADNKATASAPTEKPASPPSPDKSPKPSEPPAEKPTAPPKEETPPEGAAPPPPAKPGADAAKDDKAPSPAVGEKPAPATAPPPNAS